MCGCYVERQAQRVPIAVLRQRAALQLHGDGLSTEVADGLAVVGIVVDCDGEGDRQLAFGIFISEGVFLVSLSRIEIDII